MVHGLKLALWFFNAMMSLKAADEMINHVDSDQILLQEQSDLGVYCLCRSFCPNT